MRINMAMDQWLARIVFMMMAGLGRLVTMMLEMVVTPLVVLWLAMVAAKMATGTDDLFQFVIAEFLCHKILFH